MQRSKDSPTRSARSRNSTFLASFSSKMSFTHRSIYISLLKEGGGTCSNTYTSILEQWMKTSLETSWLVFYRPCTIFTSKASAIEVCYYSLECHAITHGSCADLKPENVLLTISPSSEDDAAQSNVTVKLCDFGVSCKFRRRIMLQEFCGSPGFFAPEMITQGCYQGDKVDMWSIGCILLELALGHRRFCLYWMRAYSYDVIHDCAHFDRRISDSVNTILTRQAFIPRPH